MEIIVMLTIMQILATFLLS